MLVASVRHCLGNLLTFSGRDRRRMFWPYCGLVVGVGWAVWTGCFMLGFLWVLATRPGAAFPSMVWLLPVLVAITASIVVLTGAAISRRLHDRNLPGWIGLIPLLLLGWAGWWMRAYFVEFGQPGSRDGASFELRFFSNAAYNVSLIALIVLLALPSSPRENRYGPPPV